MTAEIATQRNDKSPMKVTFYGKLAAMLGQELELAVEAPCTVAGLRSRIAASHPEAAQVLEDRRVRACIGNSLVADDHRLAPADEVEFLAPVSGG
jgi:molybdopterin converting factor small subunit